MSDQWQQRSLASLGSYENGFAFNELHWSEHGLPIIRIAQITGSQGIVQLSQLRRLPSVIRTMHTIKLGQHLSHRHTHLRFRHIFCHLNFDPGTKNKGLTGNWFFLAAGT